MRAYVRITFLPDGAKRRRTTWAIKLREHKGRVTYLVCDKFGETEKEVGTDEKGTPIERKEIVLCLSSEVVEKPARMNLKYAELELRPLQ